MAERPISEKDYLNPRKYIIITSSPNEMAEAFEKNSSDCDKVNQDLYNKRLDMQIFGNQFVGYETY